MICHFKINLKCGGCAPHPKADIQIEPCIWIFFTPSLPPPSACACMHLCVRARLPSVNLGSSKVCLALNLVHYYTHLESWLWISVVTGIRPAGALIGLFLCCETWLMDNLSLLHRRLVPTWHFNPAELKLLRVQWTQWVRGPQSVGTWSEGRHIEWDGCFGKSKGRGSL